VEAVSPKTDEGDAYPDMQDDKISKKKEEKGCGGVGRGGGGDLPPIAGRKPTQFRQIRQEGSTDRSRVAPRRRLCGSLAS